MYDILKSKLLVFATVGCKLSEWIYFNNICSEKLTNKEYSYIKKMKAYKHISNFFKTNLSTLFKNNDFQVNNNLENKSYKEIINQEFQK